MKIWYSVTRIPSIFQTSTHVWGKSINCLLVLGFKLSNLYFWSIQEANPCFHFAHGVSFNRTLFASQPPLFPLPFSENSFPFLKSSLVVWLNRGYQPTHPVPTWSFQSHDVSRFPAVGRNASAEEMVGGLAARVAGKAPTSCEPVSFYFLNTKTAWVNSFLKRFFSLFFFFF